MHPNLIGTNETEKIATDVFGQALDVHSSDLFSWKHHINEYRRVIAPVKTETMVDFLDERIARVPHLQLVDSV